MSKLRKVLFIFVVVVISVVVGWFTYPRSETPNAVQNIVSNIEEGTNVSFAIIADDYYTGFERDALVVASTTAEWRTLWDRLHAEVTPKPIRPSVDLSEDVIVGVFQGISSGARDSNVRIRRVVDTNSARVIDVVFEEPERTCTIGQSQFIGRPYKIITVPHTKKPLKMHKDVESIPCPR